MSAPHDHIQMRSQSYLLFALGFSHPSKEMFNTLVSGEYEHSLVATSGRVVDSDLRVNSVALNTNYVSFESEYIRIFHTGHHGQPIVGLNASDHPGLLDGESRPDFLLHYSAWYRHFGLKTATDDYNNELPDHITCQLELLAWLAHLEHKAAGERAQRQAYILAQRDVLDKLLYPFLEALVKAMKNNREKQPVPLFYIALLSYLKSYAGNILAALSSQLDDIHSTENDIHNNCNQIETVNLWG